MAYGTMGGEGQPQTQAALFSRYARFGVDLQQAISAPRWLLGRTWGDVTTSLKLEDGFDEALYTALADAGISDYGSHVNVDESGIERWRTEAKRSKIKVG